MPHDRRTPEASPLRDLFQEQWSRLQDLLERREAERIAEREREQAISSAVDDVVDQTDARIRAIGNYKRRLRENVHALVEHISELTERLPPALPVSRQNFLDNPMLNSMFVDPREMQLTFSRSHELQEFFAAHDLQRVEEAYLLLFLGKREKTVLGMEQQGGEIVRDVKQTTINFFGHQVAAPSLTEAEVRSSLKSILFESVVNSIRAELLCESTKDSGRGAALEKKDPESCLDTLCTAISNPKKLINLSENALRISRLGILLPEDAEGKVNKVLLQELEIGEGQQRVVVIAKYPKSELLPPEKPAHKFPVY
jgi:hypothetical protein